MTSTDKLTPEAVLDEIRLIIVEALDHYELADTEITLESTFHEDLGLESIDLVTVGSALTDRYGEQVNLAAFLADMDLDDVIDMRISLLVDFVLAKAADTVAKG